MAAQADPSAMYSKSNKENHKSRPSSASKSSSSNAYKSNLPKNYKTAGLLNDASRRSLDRFRARICSRWNLSSVDEAFPHDIRPQKPLAVTSMNYLQQISSAVSLDVARRLFMKECEVKKAEGQEREWAAVGYSQCRNIAQMLEEVSSQTLHYRGNLNAFQEKKNEAYAKKSKILTFKISPADLQALGALGAIHNDVENLRNDQETSLPHKRTTPDTIEMSLRKKQRRESTSNTSTESLRSKAMQTPLGKQRGNADLAEHVFVRREQELPGIEENEATEAVSTNTSETIVVDCSSYVAPIAVMHAASRGSASVSASPSVIDRDADENYQEGAWKTPSSDAALKSSSTKPAVLSAAQSPLITTPAAPAPVAPVATMATVAPSSRPPYNTLRVYAAGMMSIVREAWTTNLADARRLVGTSAEQEELVQEVNVAFAVGLDGIDARIRGIFKNLEERE